ncbi:GntR family transcriptional regulator [Saxibacter everestensis]|uniref:GntR family transcriptional regulator n=1 Tax=Saxibacter everestensis TaxID=2909229 RepID=A0ABY8R0I9_9MICO|nr:GntR family transcriptional regulator [Brevibacteriaceae bacterium ZFBP1038]
MNGNNQTSTASSPPDQLSVTDPPASSVGTESTPASIEIASKIKDAILVGRIPLGSPITERWISEQYGVSRTTVRQVLHLLISDRYVERQPYRSASVRTLNERDLRENLDARLLLEVAAARSCAEAGPQELQRLQDAISGYSSTLDTEDSIAAISAHNEFHTALVAVTGNRALTRFEGELMLDASLFIEVINVQLADTTKMRMAHVRLAGAFLAGDAALAEHLVREHLSMVTTATETFSP